MMLAAGIVAAVAFGWLLGSGAPIEPNGTEGASSVSDATDSETTPTTVTTTTSAPPPRGLAILDVPLSEAVPGFTDTIVMLTTPSESFNVMRWRPSQPETEVVLSVERRGTPVGLDVSGNWFAENLDGGVLIVHSLRDQSVTSPVPEAIGLRVESVSWHDTEPGWLAWLACSRSSSGSAVLYTLDIEDSAAEPVPVRAFEQGCLEDAWTDSWDVDGVWLERWGHGGMLMEVAGGGDFDQILIDAQGSEIPIELDSSMLADGPDGISIWRDGREHRLDAPFPASADGDQRSPVPILANDAWLFGASWSPDGRHLALNLEPGLTRPDGVFRVVHAATGAVIVKVEQSEFGVITTAWSNDGRFFLYESFDEGAQSAALVIYDTATRTTTSVPLAEIVDEIRIQ